LTRSDASEAPKDEELFFLVGTTRAGTTLLGLMLDHHPQIAFPGEFELAVDFVSSEDRFPDVDAYAEWLGMNRQFRFLQLEADRDLAYPALVRSLLAQMKQRSKGVGKPLVGVAVHRHYDRLLRLFPEARYVHIVRDPRDVGVSWLEKGWSGNLWAASREWCALEALWDRVAARIPPERRHELRLEDLLRDPTRELTGICRALGVTYDPAMLTYPEDTTYEAVDPRQIGKWRTQLERDEVRLAEAGLDGLLEARGYERSGEPARRIGPLHARLLRIDDWWNRLLSRIRLFGLGLWLCDQLARVLGLASWRRRLELRRQAVINQILK
jgi:hypothetical protein